MVYADDAEKFGAWPGMHERMQNRPLAAPLPRRPGGQRRLAASHDAGRVHRPRAAAGQSLRARGELSRNGALVDAWPDSMRTECPTKSPRPVRPERHRQQSHRRRPCRPAPGAISASNTPKSTRCIAGCCRSAAAAAATDSADDDGPLVEQAQQALYRAQCGCAYWHGIFGGVYLPHLRQAVYRNLIEAETLLDAAAGEPSRGCRPRSMISISTCIKSCCWPTASSLAPRARSRRAALRAGRARCRRKLLATLVPPARAVSSAGFPAQRVGHRSHDRSIYDKHLRKSLLDHFFDPRTTLDEVVAGTRCRTWRFLAGRYRARLRRIHGGVCSSARAYRYAHLAKP